MGYITDKIIRGSLFPKIIDFPLLSSSLEAEGSNLLSHQLFFFVVVTFLWCMVIIVFQVPLFELVSIGLAFIDTNDHNLA